MEYFTSYIQQNKKGKYEYCKTKCQQYDNLALKKHFRHQDKELGKKYKNTRIAPLIRIHKKNQKDWLTTQLGNKIVSQLDKKKIKNHPFVSCKSYCTPINEQRLNKLKKDSKISKEKIISWKQKYIGRNSAYSF